MLLTITTTHVPATDLGYLLHKHPQKCQSFSISIGKAHVFYPEASEGKCTAALLLDIDPITLTRRQKGRTDAGFILKPYVNDRPYVASSFVSVAISKVFSTAMAGRCNDKPELVNKKLPFEVKISVLPARGGKSLLTKLFEPLGYEVEAIKHLLDDKFTDWGESSLYSVTLRNQNVTLHELLTHLYVLIPVLDNEKHYWVGKDEVEKLLRKGEDWLADHPEKELIIQRYLKHIKGLTRQALQRLMEEEPEAEDSENEVLETESIIEKKIPLNKQRMSLVVEVLKNHHVKNVLDLGCGEGKLLRLLLREKSFEKILGMDVSSRALMIARERLHFDEMSPKMKERIDLIQGSLTYRDRRLEGFDSAVLIEVIEHLDSARLAALERVVFEFAKPGVVVVTTPNAEYNVKFENLPADKFRHSDHRFEWTRKEFQAWAKKVAQKNHYEVGFLPVGPEDKEVGSLTQMGVFKL